MSKADICSTKQHVRFGPIADIASALQKQRTRPGKAIRWQAVSALAPVTRGWEQSETSSRNLRLVLCRGARLDGRQLTQAEYILQKFRAGEDACLCAWRGHDLQPDREALGGQATRK